MLHTALRVARTALRAVPDGSATTGTGKAESMDQYPGSPTRIAVIGIGNDHRRDDGVGWVVAAELAGRRLPHGVTVFRTDGEPTRLISAWEGAQRAIVVDAARSHPSRPGRIHRLRLPEELPSGPFHGTSSHGFALEHAVELAHVLGRLPGELVVYAVEAANTGPGTALSPAVAAAVHPLVARIERDLAARRGPDTGG
ncbi:hydrogenase maturation protease [Streptomyces sp. NPDC057579]|uniref:hydrogenase maturation protease n=1 Tax=unclassified Streptomyces TaxID=2593676 RepID=UPI00368F6DA8